MLADSFKISRRTLYYDRVREKIDNEVKSQIESTLTDFPSYGHKRIALALCLNKKRIRRVMKKFNIKPYRRRIKRPDWYLHKLKIKKQETKNVIENFCPIAPDIVWATDFTYIKYRGRFIYLATIIDIYTREITGANVSRFHNKFLVMGALKNALSKKRKPKYLHYDQGSEYGSEDFEEELNIFQIVKSLSRKGSPWENAFKESFYSTFKVDLGDPNRFETLGELIAEIYHCVWKYNNRRIHSSLKMPPVKFKNEYYRIHSSFKKVSD